MDVLSPWNEWWGKSEGKNDGNNNISRCLLIWLRWLPTRIFNSSKLSLTYTYSCIIIIWWKSILRCSELLLKNKNSTAILCIAHLWRLFPKKCQRRACASLFVRTAAAAVTEPPEKRRPAAAARRWRQQDWAGAEPPRAFVIYNKLHSSRVSFTLSLPLSLSPTLSLSLLLLDSNQRSTVYIIIILYIVYIYILLCVQKKIAQVATDAATAAAPTRDLHAEIMCHLCVCVFLPIYRQFPVLYINVVWKKNYFLPNVSFTIFYMIL